MRSRDRRRATGALLALTGLAFACVGSPPLQSESNPMGPTHLVMGVVQRGPFLDANLEGLETGSPLQTRPESIRFFFPDDEVCRGLLRPEATVRYVALGTYGELRADDGGSCPVVGIGSLRTWANRRGRPQRAAAIPRGTARFRLVWQDEEISLARGRWPLAGFVNWVGGQDTIGVLPRTERCDTILERGSASIEFHDGGDPLRLVARGGGCALLGFVQPMGELR